MSPKQKACSSCGFIPLDTHENHRWSGPYVTKEGKWNREWIVAQPMRFYLHRVSDNDVNTQRAGKWCVIDRGWDLAKGKYYTRKADCIKAFIKSREIKMIEFCSPKQLREEAKKDIEQLKRDCYIKGDYLNLDVIGGYYFIELELLNTPERLLHWVVKLSGKHEITKEILEYLVIIIAKHFGFKV